MAVVLYHLLRHLCQHTFGQSCRWRLQVKKEKDRLKIKDVQLKCSNVRLRKQQCLLQTESEHLSLFENVSVGDYTPVKTELVTHLPRLHEWPWTESEFKCSLLLFSMHGIKTLFNSRTVLVLLLLIFPHWPCKPYANIKQRNPRLATDPFEMVQPRQWTKEYFIFKSTLKTYIFRTAFSLGF